MPAVAEKVELGFDENGPGNFFILDDPTQGVLDNPGYVLGGGSFFYDVSAYVTSISVNRGKSRALDRYQSGNVNVTFNNRNRFFDPTFVASPFYGQIVPRRDVRISSNYQAAYTATRTNLVTNPSLETNATEWTFVGSALFTRITTDAYVGSACGRVTGLGQIGARIMGTSRMPVTAGQVFTASVYVKDESTNAQFRNEIYWYNSGGSLLSITTGIATTVSTSSWTRVSLSATAPTNATMAQLVCRTSTSLVTSSSALFDAALFEQSSSLGDYFSGSSTNISNSEFTKTYAWTGTANASTSTEVSVFAETGLVFLGTTEDWNLDYSPDGDSTATVSAADGFAFLAQQTLPAGTNPVELSGARVNRVLDSAGVAWPSGARTIDAGNETLQGDEVTPADNALQYLQLIESSEPGELFIGRDGNLVFQDRNHVFPSTAVPLLTDDASGITYSQVRVVYGSELLFTQSEISRKGSTTIVQANDLTAQEDYGVRTLTLDGLLQNTDEALVPLATYYVSTYAQPEYRFEQVELILSQLSSVDQGKILGLDLGSVVQVQFTPNGIAPAISKYARVISISHTTSLVEHRVVLGLGTLNATLFQLDDAAFGILDTGTLAF
jgi:hypothetical protein